MALNNNNNNYSFKFLHGELKIKDYLERSKI